MSRIVSRTATDYTSKTKAFPYQLEAFLTVRDLDYSAIFHEQGLGKTKIAVDLMLYWLKHRDIDTVMIVTKKQLVRNWENELAVHTYIKPKVLSSNKASNFYVFNSPAKVVIANFEVLSTDKERMKLFLKCRNVAIIIDESTKLKNPDAQLTKDYFELADLFKIRTIMTGTPVANRPYDIWAQIYFLDKGQSLGPDFAEFKRHTDLSNKLGSNREARKLFESTVASIFEKISEFTVRETKKSCAISLPQKVYESVYTSFEPMQYRMYRTVLHELKIEIEQDGNTIIDDDGVALKRLLRLLQIASNPRLLNETYTAISGKEQQLKIQLEEICSVGDKCIVWSNFIENIDLFHKKFKCYNPCKIHGSMAIEDRNTSVDKFKTDPTCMVLFATPQAAKEGLTLTVANHVIFYDRGFNLDDYLQAQDRIHRISQKKTCYIYNFITQSSIDEWIDKLIQAKHYAALLAQGDIPQEEYIQVADYTYSEIIREILEAGENMQ